MGKLTKKFICSAAAKRHGLSLDMVELHRDQGTWYWAGKAAAVFDSSMISYMNLNDWPLERWLEDFDSNVEEWKANPYNADKTLRQYLDDVDWNIKNHNEPRTLRLGSFQIEKSEG